MQSKQPMPFKKPDTPPIDTANLVAQAKGLPESPGVYYFLSDNEYPIYIGKSINLKQRVLSQFYAANRDSKENKIARSACKISFDTTPGELGALIQESVQVKKYLPLYNRQLRRQKKLFTWSIDESKPYHSLMLTEAIWPPPSGGQYYGLYRSATQAKRALEKVAIDNKLCKKVLGLERIQTTCFAFQLKKCLGACKELESCESHNSRLAEALEKSIINHWPFPGSIGVIENQATFAYIFDQWNYLGTSPVSDLKHKRAPSSTISQTVLDRDTYRILLSSLTKKREDLNIVSLSAAK